MNIGRVPSARQLQELPSSTIEVVSNLESSTLIARKTAKYLSSGDPRTPALDPTQDRIQVELCEVMAPEATGLTHAP